MHLACISGTCRTLPPPKGSRLCTRRLCHGTDVSRSLEELLGNEPGFKSVEVIIERRTNRSRGFAIASFDSAEHAKAAIDKYDQSELDGRTIQARIDHGRRRRHGRDGPGEHEEGE